MIKNKRLYFYLLLIFAILCPSWLYAAQDENKGRGSSRSLGLFSSQYGDGSDEENDDSPVRLVVREQQGASSQVSSPVQDLLEPYFTPTVATIKTGKTARQVLGGLMALIASWSAVQVSAPLFLGSLADFGVTSDMLPFSFPLLIGVSALPALAGSIFAYQKTAQALKPIPDDIGEVQKKVTTQTYSRAETMAYSSPETVFEQVFFTAIYFYMIWQLEKNVEGWGPPIFWTIAFTAFYSVALYFMYVSPYSHPSGNPRRRYATEQQKKSHQKLLFTVAAVEQEIKDEGLASEDLRSLAGDMNVILTSPLPASEGTPLNLKGDNASRGSGNGDGDQYVSLEAEQPSESSVSLNEPKYKQVFRKMIRRESLISQDEKEWNHRKEDIARWMSEAIQVLGLPMQYLTAYGLTHALTSSFLPDAPAMAVSILTTVAAAPPITAGAYRMIPLVQDVFRDVLNLCQSDSVPYWGARIAPTLAIVTALAYGVFPAEYFLRHHILEEAIHIHNAANRIIPIPFLCTIFAGAYHLSSRSFTTFSTWVAKGMQINLGGAKFKLLSCFDPKGQIKDGQKLLAKVKELEEKIREMNPEYAVTLLGDLGVNIDPEDVSGRSSSESENL